MSGRTAQDTVDSQNREAFRHRLAILRDSYLEQSQDYLRAGCLLARAVREYDLRQIDVAEAAAMLAEARQYLGPSVEEVMGV